MYTKPAFISVFSGFLSSSQNRQKSINPRIKIRTFENQMTSSLCLRQFFCLYVMIEKQPDTIKNMKKDEYAETKMSKMQDLKSVCHRKVTSLTLKNWIIKEASYAEAQSIK